jgi:hypothetical protein
MRRGINAANTKLLMKDVGKMKRMKKKTKKKKKKMHERCLEVRI